MNLGIIHITDFHTKDNDTLIKRNMDSLAVFGCKVASEVDQILWAITGDVADQGKAKEYEWFFKQFDACRNRVRDRFPAVRQTLVAVPGNHDCDFSDPGSVVRETIVRSLENGTEKNFTDDHLKICVSVQKQFSDAMTGAGALHPGLTACSSIVWQFGQEKNEVLEIALINSAATSTIRESYGGKALPESCLQKLNSPAQADIRVFLLHHPISWFSADVQRKLRAILERSETICLMGHEHQQDARAIKPLDLEGELPAIVIDGGVFKGKNSSESTFNFVRLDYGARTLSFSKVSLQSDLYVAAPATTHELCRQSVAVLRRIKPTAGTFEWLDEHDMQIFRTHGNRPVSLQQLFVFPDLDDLLNIRADRIGTGRTVTRSFLDIFTADFKFITGAEKSGKTALLKRLYAEMWGKGGICLYIDGRTLTKASKDAVSRAIEKAFVQQYRPAGGMSWFALGADKVFLLIDDLDMSPVTEALKPKLLSIIAELSPKTVITSTEMFGVEGPLAMSLKDQDKSAEYFRIREFGNAKRDELVMAWLKIDKPSDIHHDELVNDAEAIRRELDQVVTDDVVPRSPFFLITILQKISDKSAGTLAKSALGHYYEFLIHNGLTKAEVGSLDVKTYHSIYTELAFELLKSGRTNIDELELKKFFDRHCSTFEISLSFTTFIKAGVSARILGLIDSVYSFYYSYQYLFYAGRALAMRLDESGGKDLLKRLLERAYNSDIANIILFVAHFTRQKVVIDELMSSCDLLFAETAPLQLQGDVASINSLVVETPRLMKNGDNLEESRRKRLEKLDKDVDTSTEYVEEVSLRTRREQQLSIDFQSDKTILALDKFEKAVVAHKFIEILGQALYNHASDINKDDKTIIVQTSTLLALRTARFIIEDVITHFSHYIPYFSADLDQQDRVEFHKRFGRAAFNFFSMIAFHFVSLVSKSFGFPELKTTVQRVFVDEDWAASAARSPGVGYDIDVPRKLILMGIKLQAGGQLPFSRLQELFKEFEGNLTADLVLRFLLHERVDMAPMTIGDKQRADALLKIGVASQELNDKRNQ